MQYSHCVTLFMNSIPSITSTHFLTTSSAFVLLHLLHLMVLLQQLILNRSFPLTEEKTLRLDIPVMADWPWDLPAVLFSIFDCSTEESSLVHELFRNAANINTCTTETPLGTCLKRHFQRSQQYCLTTFKLKVMKNLFYL